MKILAVYNTDQMLGGGEISFTLSLRLAQQLGCEVLALIPGEGPLAGHLKKHQIPYVIAPQESFRHGLNIQFLVKPKTEWLEVARDYRPDLIHCNAIRSALYAQAVARRLNIPTILHARKSETNQLLDCFLLLRLDAIVCISQLVRRRFPTWLAPEKLRVIYNAVDLGAFERKPARAETLRTQWRREQDDLLVGVIGRLSPIKGQHRLVKAAPEILRKAPHTTFVLVGSEDPSFPGYEVRLRDEINKMALENRFVLAGFEPEIESIYHALDLVVFPTCSEGFGRIVIEAGAARKALVCSDIEVLREVLSAELADLAVPLEDTEALALRVSALLQSESLRAETARRLHDHVARHFGLESHGEQLVRLYLELSTSKSRL
jgi:glycosyltransferase involved in cell wall biosynthesis